jgi:adenosylcobinamide kinase/adenosylcobinamide-phosphate guanylyltransferase
MKPVRRKKPAGRGKRKGGRLILMIGGSSSGKSAAALTLAGRAGRRVFVATGQPLDQEMAQRIQRHRASRGPEWETAEVAVDLIEWFQAKGPGYRTILLDCLTLWLSNLCERGVSGQQVPDLTSRLLQAMRATKARVVIVTNELGLGLVPMDASARTFRDLAGWMNQQFAAEADEVHFVVAGQAMRIK